MVAYVGQAFILPSYRNSCIGFQLEYLQLTLFDSKGQVKVVRSSIAIISQIVIDSPNIYEDRYVLSIGIVPFNLDQF